MSDHQYLSTACLHEQHAECRQVCKFCPKSCECECGHETPPKANSCPNVSYYGRPCVLPPHGWQQSCTFRPAGEYEYEYDPAGSTLAELLEACSAGGPVAISAAMRWIEYRLHNDAEDIHETRHSLAISVAEYAVQSAQREQVILFEYLSDPVPDQFAAGNA